MNRSTSSVQGVGCSESAAETPRQHSVVKPAVTTPTHQNHCHWKAFLRCLAASVFSSVAIRRAVAPYVARRAKRHQASTR